MSRTPLWLSAVGFLLLLGVAWWVLRDRGGEEEGPFFTLGSLNPDTLTVAYGPDTTVVVRRDEHNWRVIRPVDYPADPTVADGMVRRLADLGVERVFPLVPEKMDTYGMRHPRAMIRASYREATEPDTLFVGGFSMGGTYDYVRAGSETRVGMIPSREVRTYLLKSTLDFRETRLMPFYEPGVTRLELRGPDGEVRVSLVREDRAWRLEKPFPGPADNRKTGEYLNSVNHMHIEAFIREGDGPLEPYGLTHPRARLRVTLRDGEVYALALGTPVPGTDLIHAVTLTQPHILGVSWKYLPVLERPADTFRQTAPVGFGLDRVDSVRVEVSGGGRTLAPEGPDLEPIVARNLDEVLRNWIRLRADGFEEATTASLRKWGLQPAPGKLIWMGKGDTLAVVEIGVPSGGRFPIRVSQGEEARAAEVLLLPEASVTPLWSYLERSASAGPGSP